MKTKILHTFPSIVLILLFSASFVNATTYYSRATGVWNSTTSTWSLTSGGVVVAAYPVAGDIVIIEQTFTVTVNISNAACASLQLGGTATANAGTLTFSGTSPSLTVSGSVLIGNSGNLARDGFITFTSGSTLTAGSVTLGGTGGTPAQGTITMTAGGTLITGSFTVGAGSGTWTPGTGTVILNATNTLPATIFTTFNNLTIDGGTTTMARVLTINNNLSILNGTLADGGFQITGNGTGTLSVANGATLQIGAGTATITSFPTNFTTAHITLNPTSTVNYSTITNAQNVAGSVSSVGPSTYGHLTITGASGTKTLTNAITVAGNLTIATSGETFADGGFQITGNATGTLSVANGATLQIGAGGANTETFPTLYTTAHISLGATSTVIYNSTSAMTVAGSVTSVGPSTYGHLTLSGAGTKTAAAAITIAGNLTINAGTFADGGFTITVNGNVANSGAHTGAGSITLNGGSSAHTLSGTGSYTNLTLNDANGATESTSANVIINGTLNLTAGTFTVGANTLTLTGPAITGTPTNLTTGITSNLVFGGSSLVSIPSSVTQLNALTINNSNAAGVSLNNSITLNQATAGVLTLTTGFLILGSYNLTIGSSAAGATITGGSATAMVIATGTGQLKKTFPTSGFAAFTYPVGDLNGSDHYSPFVITFSANNTVRTIGVRVTNAKHPSMDVGYIQSNYTNRYWTFTDSQAGVGTYTYTSSFSYSTTTTTDIVGTVNGTNDKINRWSGSAWSSLTSTFAAPTFSATGATQITGPLNGDYTIRYNPTGIVYTWIATSGSASWATSTSWSPTRTTPAATDVLQFSNGGTPTATNVPSQTIAQIRVLNNTNITLQSASAGQTLLINGAASYNNISIASGSTLQISSTGVNQLGIAFVTTSTQYAYIAGTLIINPNTGLTNSFSTTYTTCVTTVPSGGVITNNGGVITGSAAALQMQNGSTYNHAMNGGVIPTATWGASSLVNITGITSTNATGFGQIFGDFTWNTTGQTATGAINAAMTVAGDLTVSSGTLADGHFQITGNATGMLSVANGATLQIGDGTATTETFPTLYPTANISLGATSTVIYNSTGAMTVAGSVTSVGPSTYGHLTLSGNSTKTVASALTIAGNLTTINAGTFNGGTSFTHNIGGNWTNNGSFTYTTASTISFNGSSTAIIAGSATTSFNNLTINKGTPSVTVTSQTTAFTASGNLDVTQGNLVLQAYNDHYAVTGNLSVAATGTLTHEVDWDTRLKQLNVGGNIAIDGVYSKGSASRSHVQMTGTSKTVKTGSSAFNILTINGGTISANGPVTVDNNFWTPILTGSFSTNGYPVIAKGALLVSGGTFNLNGGSLNVISGITIGFNNLSGTFSYSSGDLTTDGITIGDGGPTGTGTFTQSASGTNTIVNGTVTINQQTAAATNAWNINAGTATVSGNISLPGTNTTTGFNSTIVLTTGTLNANGGITFAGATPARKIVNLGTTGTINLTWTSQNQTGKLRKFDEWN